MLILSGGLIVVCELEGKGMYRYETPDLMFFTTLILACITIILSRIPSP